MLHPVSYYTAKLIKCLLKVPDKNSTKNMLTNKKRKITNKNNNIRVTHNNKSMQGKKTQIQSKYKNSIFPLCNIQIQDILFWQLKFEADTKNSKYYYFFLTFISLTAENGIVFINFFF